jgi:uncharacterized membrane protein SpoIIM required for sporulation
MKFTLCVDIKRRVLYLSIGIAVFVISYYIGTVADTTHYQSEADNIRQEFNENVKHIDRNEIFLNNLGISLRMFIPAVGIGYGLSTGFSTGFISMAMAESSPLLTNLTPFSDLIKPFGFMEIIAYGLAISRSGILVYQFVKKKHWKSYFIPSVLEIGIVTVILLVAATVEWNTITGIVGPHHHLP